MGRKYPNLNPELLEHIQRGRTPRERIVLPPTTYSTFLLACFAGTNLLVWAAFASDTPIWLYWSAVCGLSGGIFFAGFLIAEIQESILGEFQSYFLATVALVTGGSVGKWFGETQLVYVLSSTAFTVVASLGLVAIFKEGDLEALLKEANPEKMEELSWSLSKTFWIRSVVLIVPFMFALATSTASFDTLSQATALIFTIPAIVGFMYVFLCPPSGLHEQREILYQLLTLILAVGLGSGCVIGFANPFVLFAVIGSLFFLVVTRFSVANFER